MWLVAAPLDHVVGTVTATLRVPQQTVDNSTITYRILPNSFRAVDKFNNPVTSPSTPYDYTVSSVIHGVSKT